MRQIKVIQERKNGWVVAIRSGKLYLLHSLDAPHSGNPETAARFVTKRCHHSQVTEAKGIWAFITTDGGKSERHLGMPREDHEEMVKYKKVRYCTRPSCEVVMEARL